MSGKVTAASHSYVTAEATFHDAVELGLNNIATALEGSPTRGRSLRTGAIVGAPIGVFLGYAAAAVMSAGSVAAPLADLLTGWPSTQALSGLGAGGVLGGFAGALGARFVSERAWGRHPRSRSCASIEAVLRTRGLRLRRMNATSPGELFHPNRRE